MSQLQLDPLLGAIPFSAALTGTWDLFADPETAAHLRETVFAPIRTAAAALVAKEEEEKQQEEEDDAGSVGRARSSVATEATPHAPFFWPPALTTFRVVGGVDAVCFTPSLTHASSLASLASCGLPECTVFYRGQEGGGAAAAEDEPEGRQRQQQRRVSRGDAAAAELDPDAVRTALAAEGPFDVALVVDTGCAEAVMRGSDVYAPGIVASAGPGATTFGPGNKALIVFVPPSSSSNSGGGSSSGAGGLTKGTTLPSAEGLVAIAAGVVTMHRYEIMHTGGSAPGSPLVTFDGTGCSSLSSSVPAAVAALSVGSPIAISPPSGSPAVKRTGLAVRTTWCVSRQLSRAALGALLQPPVAESNIFLQNFSSMVPAAIVSEFLSCAAAMASSSSPPSTSSPVVARHIAVLDMTAAPGGKSSHLLARAARHGWLTGGNSAGCQVQPVRLRLTACERSGQRCRQMREVLRSHFGDTVVDDCVELRTVDANKLARNPALEAPLSLPQTEGADAVVAQFDAVMLDPPCTGFGLRPHLAAHEHTVQSITESADYQRKLFSSAVQLVRPGGLIVYSTCTITVEENENNVAHFLEAHRASGIRLVHAPAAPATGADGCTSIGAADEADPDLPRRRFHAQLQSLLALRGGDGGWIPTAPLVAALDAASQEIAAEEDARSVPFILRFGPASVAAAAPASSAMDSVGFFVAAFTKMQV